MSLVIDFDHLHTSAPRICQSTRNYGYFAALYRVVREAQSKPVLSLLYGIFIGELNRCLLALPQPSWSCGGASKYNNSSSSSGRGWHRSWFANDPCYCLRLRLLHSDKNLCQTWSCDELCSKAAGSAICLGGVVGGLYAWHTVERCRGAVQQFADMNWGMAPRKAQGDNRWTLGIITRNTVTEVWNAYFLGATDKYVIVLCFVEVKEARRAHRRGRRRGKDSLCMSRNCFAHLRHTETYSKRVVRMLYMHMPTGSWRVGRRWVRGF